MSRIVLSLKMLTQRALAISISYVGKIARSRKKDADIKGVVIPGIVYIMVPWEHHQGFFSTLVFIL